MTRSDAPAELPNFTKGSAVLEARRIPRELTSDPDVVLCWSTDAGPYDLIMRCPPIVPGRLRGIQIIADEDIMTGDPAGGLLEALQDRSIVRFNASDWSVIWMAETKTQGAEIQLIFRQLPGAMTEMVRQTMSAFSEDTLDEFFAQLRAAVGAKTSTR